MSLYIEAARVVDAEQIDVSKGVFPGEVIPWAGPVFDGSVGYVIVRGPKLLGADARRSVNVFDHDWIVRCFDGEVRVVKPCEFLRRHLGYLETLGDQN